MDLKKILAATAVAGWLGAAAVGLGAGIAQAKPHVPWVPDIPGVPGVDEWVPNVDVWPGPGDIKNVLCPWDPPGHWMGGPHGMPCT